MKHFPNSTHMPRLISWRRDWGQG